MVTLYAQASNTFITSQTYQKWSGDVILCNSGRYCSVYKLQNKTEYGLIKTKVISSGVASPKIWWGAKNFGGNQNVWFLANNAILFGKTPPKAQNVTHPSHATNFKFFGKFWFLVPIFREKCQFFPCKSHAYDLHQGWGTYLLSRAAWIVRYRWRAAKTILS